MEYRALFWIACLFANSLPWITGVQVFTREAQILLEMKKSLKDPQNALNDWTDSIHAPCNWTGITCDSTAGKTHFLHGLMVLRLKEALKFLAENCSVVTQWLEDVVEYMDKNCIGQMNYLPHLKLSLENLRALQGDEQERAKLDGWLMAVALVKLEGEFKRLLVEHTVLLKAGDILPSDRPCIARDS